MPFTGLKRPRMVRQYLRSGKYRFVPAHTLKKAKPKKQTSISEPQIVESNRVCFLKGNMKEARYGEVLAKSKDGTQLKIRCTNNNFECWIPASCVLHVSQGRPIVKPQPVFLPPIILEGAADKLLKQIRREPILMPKRRKLIDNRKVRTAHIWKLLLALSRLEKIPPSSWNSLTNVDLDHISGIFRQRGFVKLLYVSSVLARRYKRIWVALGRERKRRTPDYDKKVREVLGPSRWERIRQQNERSTNTPNLGDAQQ